MRAKNTTHARPTRVYALLLKKMNFFFEPMGYANQYVRFTDVLYFWCVVDGRDVVAVFRVYMRIEQNKISIV